MLNTPLINGNALETFKIHDVAIEQFQMVIEFMSSVDREHCMFFHFSQTFSKIIFIFIQQNGNLVARWKRWYSKNEDYRTEFREVCFLPRVIYCWLWLLHQTINRFIILVLLLRKSFLHQISVRCFNKIHEPRSYTWVREWTFTVFRSCFSDSFVVSETNIGFLIFQNAFSF